MAPIAVVNTVFSSGEANRGVQTAAFNLPNDEQVIREKGSKRVMLKNNQQAKFDTVLMPEPEASSLLTAPVVMNLLPLTSATLHNLPQSGQILLPSTV